MSLFGIIIALVGLMYACMRGWNIVVAAPIFAIIVALTGGLEVLPAITETYMGGLVGFAKSFFLLFLLGAVFGKIMEDSGAAASVGNWVIKKIGTKNAIVAVVLATGILAYGGVSVFVVAFTIYPLAMGIFRKANLPKRLVAGSIALGSWTFGMTAFPGTPQIQNIIPTEYFGTTATAAPVLGIISGLLMFFGGSFYLNREARKAEENGEGFKIEEDSSQKIKDNAEVDEDLPSFFLSILPLITIIVSLNIFKININVSLLLGILLALIMFYKKIENHIDTINIGSRGSLIAIMNTSAAVGFGTIVRNVWGLMF